MSIKVFDYLSQTSISNIILDKTTSLHFINFWIAIETLTIHVHISIQRLDKQLIFCNKLFIHFIHTRNHTLTSSLRKQFNESYSPISPHHIVYKYMQSVH